MSGPTLDAHRVQYLLWPEPILVRPREIQHDRTPEGHKAIAWYRIGDEESWKEQPIAQNSYPEETAIRLLQGAALAEETMRSAGGPRPGLLVLRYLVRLIAEPQGPKAVVLKPAEGRSDDTLEAVLFAGIDLADPANAHLAAAMQLETLHFSGDPEDAEDPPLTVAIYPLPLGVVVRLPQDRKFPVTEVAMEYIDLFTSVLGGKGEDYSDRILKHATGGL